MTGELLADWVLARALDFASFARVELHSRSPLEWLVCFAPLLVLLEIPRYYLPLLVLYLTRLGRGRHRRAYLREHHPGGPPLISVIVAGRNEAESLDAAIRSLIEQEGARCEILVVDDGSTDQTQTIARRHAQSGRIRYVRNAALRGRGGKPAALNLGARLARGELIVAVDADTSFDRHMIANLVAHFADPRVGVVAGNVMVAGANTKLTRLQALEYLLGIDLYKRWTESLGATLQASGAVAAFRTVALREIGGWDAELAEDTDVSLRMIKAGWRVGFAPDAIAWTDVPRKMGELARQRSRWDRGAWRTFAAKHARLLRPRAAGFAVAFELGSEMLLFVGATLLVPLYLGWLLWQGLFPFLFVALVTYGAYASLALLALIPIRTLSRRSPPTRALVVPALLFPLYKEWLRWVRARALLGEFFLVGVEHPFLPRTAWANKPRF